MALSNIFREPRRELIEQGVGIIAALGYLAICYRISRAIVGPDDHWADCLLGAFIIAIGAGFGLGGLWLVALALHDLGETVCGYMKRAGIDPRPKQRY